jgi:uncharacterized protein YraI
MRSKSTLLMTLLTLITTIVFASIAMAQSLVTATPVTTINVRSGPGLGYTIRGVVPPDFTLEISARNDFAEDRMCRGLDADNDMWLRIDFNGIEGWISRCVVNIDGDVDALPTAEAATPQLISEIPPFEFDDNITLGAQPESGYVIGFTRARVNVRAGSSLLDTIVDIAPAIEPIYVIGRTENNRWVRVQYDGVSGWIARYLVQLPSDWTDFVSVQ